MHLSVRLTKLTWCMLAMYCRTDFGGAIITGADFTNALVDKSQQIVSQQNQQYISCHMMLASIFHVVLLVIMTAAAMWQMGLAQVCV